MKRDEFSSSRKEPRAKISACNSEYWASHSVLSRLLKMTHKTVSKIQARIQRHCDLPRVVKCHFRTRYLSMVDVIRRWFVLMVCTKGTFLLAPYLHFTLNHFIIRTKVSRTRDCVRLLQRFKYLSLFDKRRSRTITLSPKGTYRKTLRTSALV